MTAIQAGAAGHREPHPRLAETFTALDTAQVRWCLLRGEGRLHDPDPDIDLLVDPDDLPRLHSLLAALGYRYLPTAGRGSHRFFLTYHADTDLWLKLDVVSDLSFGRHQEHRSDVASSCLARARRIESLHLLNPDDAFWALLLHCLLDRGGEVPQQHREALRYLGTTASGTGPLAAFAMRRAPEGWTATRITLAASAADWPALEELAERYPFLPLLDRMVVSSRAATGRFIRRATRPFVLYRRRTPVVALMAPDGAGKTTLADALTCSFPVPAHRIYMGLHPSDPHPRRRRLHSPPGMGMAGRLLRFYRQLAVARYRRARGGLVVCDRHPYDVLLPGAGAQTMKRRLQRALIRRACPPPDLFMILDAPGPVLHQRSKERSAVELEALRQRYRALPERVRRRGRPAFVLIDVDRPPEQVRRAAVDAIWRRWSQRMAGRA